MTLRVAFFGTPDVAVPGLRALIAADDIDVVVVITNPDRPRGRRSAPSPPATKIAAIESGIDVWQPSRPADVADALRELNLDAAAVIAYGAILPASVLATTRHGFVNLHFSLLPRWRGAAPVQHALRAGDTMTGVTAFKLDAGMDTGPIITQRAEPIKPDDNAGTLLDRLAQSSVDLFVNAVRAVCAESHVQPQDDTAATYAPKLTKADSVIDFAASPEMVVNQIRSVNPAPGARTTFRGRQLKICTAVIGRAATALGELPVGSVVDATADRIEIMCKQGLVELVEVQPEGKRRQQAADFIRGYRPRAGERLGADDST